MHAVYVAAVCLAVASAAAFLAMAASACDNPVLEKLNEQHVLGRWVNPAYAGGAWPNSIDFTLQSDGILRCYDDAAMHDWVTAPYTIEKRWNDDSGYFYHIKFSFAAGTTLYYALVRISPDGQTYESSWSLNMLPYPEVSAFGGPDYCIAYRP
jgi:hypothetical protein